MNRPAFILVTLLAASASPVFAQQGPQSGGGEKISQAIVYGNDPCPMSTGDEIVVCAKLPEADRYRVPELFRGGDLNAPENQAWANRVTSVERIGRFGTDSCSPAGLGGFTGCALDLINGAYAERRASDKADWQALIADERAKRLAGIDAASDEVEAATVAEEKALAERERRAAELEERGGAPVSDNDADAAPLPDPKPR